MRGIKLVGGILLAAVVALPAWRIRAPGCAFPAVPPITGLALPDLVTRGRVLVANQTSTFATIVDLASGRVAQVATPEGAHGAAVSEDGRLGVISIYEPIVRGSPEGHTLVVIDMVAAQVLRTIDLGTHRPHGIAFLPGSSTQVAVTTQTSLEVTLVDVEAGTVLAAIPTNGPGSHTLTIRADGGALFTANEQDTTISRLDLGSRAFVRELGVGGEPFGLQVAPDGREVWVRSSRFVSLWTAASP